MFFLKNKKEESKIIFIYRYLSLLITSTFYLFNQSDHSILRKLFIISCLSISAIILSYLYPIYEDSHKNIKLLLIIETIGNVLLLAPSGGINSPFIWYSLNTILISSIFLEKIDYWANFIAYLFSYLIILKIGNDIEINELITIDNYWNLLLSFLMIVVVVQLLGVYIKRARIEKERLESANKQIIESIDHIKALYQSVNILANQGNREGIIKVSFEHIKRITKTDTVFYFEIIDSKNKMYTYGNNQLIDDIELYITNSIEELLDTKEPTELLVLNSRFIIVPVRSNYSDYGLLGLESKDSKESIVYQNNIYQLQFLSELISIAFERLNLEEVNERLLITEEQNRIANEIHDSVLQRLFSMSCGIFAIMKKLSSYTTDEIEEELNTIRSTTDTVMKELREKIYGLSWKKSGSNSFNLDIKRYIEDIRKLNNVNIPFTILGNVENLSTNQKKAIYRMICEGLSNAVRHGKSGNIEVVLNIGREESQLLINDDGVGFNVDEVMEDTSKGLGLQNLYQLTESLHGIIHIHSELGSGTTIQVTLPNNLELVKGGAAI
ncbi:ATP-binding protein [Tissierella sp. Yu-01]|uniref:sensor histidine kinase n=1 Tax=Tissierella sp. Yu-01 TaxID=3035694 RepID=UPI00240E6600|nr:ATP-binding protein [Tissierella sp. Yu-01]WFA08274.1 histidine kinase [Tissierella sp. Yu-01]